MIERDFNCEVLRQLDALGQKIDGLKASTKPWLSVPEVSDYLGVKPSTVYQYVHKGQIPFRKLPDSRKLIFCRNEIDQWIAGNSLEKTKQTARKCSNEIWTEVLDKHEG
jgi:excisionase family DNA binding protein